jgi:hypothetical protein
MKRWYKSPLALLCSLTLVLDAQAIDKVAPNLCTVERAPANKPNPADVQQPQDCYESSAAVGELSLGWRKKLPKHIHWLNRKDAAQLCEQSTTQFGQKVDSPVTGGCVFLKTDACTIVTAGPISPASIGNAVRSCSP